MPKATTNDKSKPAKKTIHKTFHKHVAEEPVTPTQESDSQTSQPTSETEVQPEAQPEEDAIPADSQPQQTVEDTAPATTEVTPEETENATPEVTESITPTAEDTNLSATENTSVDNNESKSDSAPEEPQQPTPSPIMDENEGKSKKPLIFIVIIAVILVALGSLYYLYTKKLKTESVKSSPTPISQTAQSPAPLTQTLNKADWTLEVLNGSSKKGAAAELAQKLTAKGYQVIKTANNPEDFATSQVFFSDKTKDQADLFLEDIKDELPNPNNAGVLKDSTASARIIIGAE